MLLNWAWKFGPTINHETSGVYLIWRGNILLDRVRPGYTSVGGWVLQFLPSPSALLHLNTVRFAICCWSLESKQSWEVGTEDQKVVETENPTTAVAAATLNLEKEVRMLRALCSSKAVSCLIGISLPLPKIQVQMIKKKVILFYQNSFFFFFFL